MKHGVLGDIKTCILYAVGLIHVGDKLKEVNGIPVDDKKPEEIIHILVSHICVCDSTLPCVVLSKSFCIISLTEKAFLVC